MSYSKLFFTREKCALKFGQEILNGDMKLHKLQVARLRSHPIQPFLIIGVKKTSNEIISLFGEWLSTIMYYHKISRK